MTRLSDRIEGLHQELVDVLMAARTAHVEPLLGMGSDATPELIHAHLTSVDEAIGSVLVRLANADLSL